MKSIFNICKTELKTLFYSPIAWFLLVILLVQSGVTYIGALDSIARMQDMGAKLTYSLGDALFYGRDGVLSVVLQNLYLYLPLLTMGLISREMNNGTIKLLYSSPINISEIVLGKFLAMMVMSLIMVLVVGLYVCFTYFVLESPDTGKVFSSFLGLYLLLCAYAAIGLFMSCLTTYQIVAAVCTFVVIWVLNAIGGVWQDIPFVRDVTYFLSLSGRTGKMINGLVTTKDVIYFLLIVFMFISFSILRLKGTMESKPVGIRVLRNLGVLALTLILGVISSIPSFVGYWDVSRNQRNTIVPKAQEIIKALGEEPLVVTAYTNLLGGYWWYGSPSSHYATLGRWEPYMRFKNNIILKNVLYYDTLNNTTDFNKYYPGKNLKQIAEQMADANNVKLSQFKTPEEFRQIMNLSDEPNWYTMQLQYKDRKTLLRVFDDPMQWPSETEVVAAIKRLTLPKVPKVLFLTGNRERSIHKMGDRDFKVLTNLNRFRHSMVNQGFDVDTITGVTGGIPTDISALVIADPRVEMTGNVKKVVTAYINEGGNLFILGEPGKQQVLNPILANVGVQLADGIVVQESKDLQADLITPLMAPAAFEMFEGLHAAHHANVTVSMPTATALTFTDTLGFVVKPLLVIDEKRSWLTKSGYAADSATVTFEPEKGDLRSPLPLVLGLTRKINNKEQRIVVAGDADFMSTQELSRSNVRTANFMFGIGVFSWLNYGDFPIDSSRPDPIDTKVFVNKDQVRIIKVVIVWVLPAVFILAGTIILLRRKRK